MQERWLSVDEIAAHLGVNPDTIYKWIDRKAMPSHKLGRLWKFLASEVDQWIKGGKAAQRPNSKRNAVKQPRQRTKPSLL
jgi:excisionase family DNA binding protein